VKPIVIDYAMFVIHFAPNVAMTTQIYSWWYGEIARIDPAQRNSDPSHAYISVVNELSQWLFSSLRLCIRLWQILLATVQQWYTTSRPQSTQFQDFEHSFLHRSQKLSPGQYPSTGLHATQRFVR
jgi:hypothetical protein